MIKEDIVYSSEYFKILKKEDGFYIESFKRGLSIDAFNSIIKNISGIKITSFMAVKDAILFAPKALVKFGESKERISVEVSSDDLKAYITLSVGENELLENNRDKLIKEILDKLKDVGVVYGIKWETMVKELTNNRRILIAEGIPPEKGEDSVVKMYTLKEPKPEIKEDGKVDHYEISLINTVKTGGWLGERIDPGSGVPGKSVKDATIPALTGKKTPLLYDKSSVAEIYENGVTTLYAKRDGAVHYESGVISVSNHLEINGNVDFKTGNIDFDGYLTVKGTVEDSFTVEATKDIEILGQYGIGSVKEVISKNGSIYIKGGIAGKNKATIRCSRNLYTKFVSDTQIVCDGNVNVGFYCINSNVKAREVILDSPKGQIIGGNIEAEVRVLASVVGSPGEKKTLICVSGFDRNNLKERLEKLITEIEELKKYQIRIKQELSLEMSKTTVNDQKIDEIHKNFTEMKNRLKECEYEKKIITLSLRAKGEGEISIIKKVHPGVTLKIKNMAIDINEGIIGATYYAQDGEIITK